MKYEVLTPGGGGLREGALGVPKGGHGAITVLPGKY